MKFSALFAVIFPLKCAAGIGERDDIELQRRRRTGESNVFDSRRSEPWIFQPLECNFNLTEVDCGSWATTFGSAASHSSEIVISCGTCVTMDHASSSLALEGGLDIQGKLLFPDGYKLSLETPYIRVQGELRMQSTKIPNGEPDVTFLLTGTDENVTQFVPADSNSNGCNEDACEVGKKPIVVAGGRLVIEALAHNFPTWVNLYDVIGENLLVVTDSVKNQWGVGSEVLITSHTLKYNDEQVRTIVNVYDHSEPGFVVIELDASVIRPTTLLDNPDFAVEVALLSRNIVFEGANDDPNELHGAHLIVFHTPFVNQKLEGVEFRNFGQQGNLGRYPIHFHLCGNVTGSTVSKNLIRESKQRCIVVHRTNNLLVDANVAYDTFGHCFMTEDGAEQGNVFRNNLGALTRRVTHLITGNGKETDDAASTFWMTNPTNSWIGNVAAGSQSNGFWFELQYEVRGSYTGPYVHIVPKEEPLTLFSNNVAHSNRDQGMRMYPSGFFPKELAVFHNSRFYRNRDGIFVHKCRNIALVGGVYADSRVQIDIDRADNIQIRDLTVIGISDEFQSVVDTQGASSVCDLYGHLNRGKSNTGIQLHTFVNDVEGSGAVIRNVTFVGFEKETSNCDKVAAISFDDEMRQGTFDYFTAVSQVQVERTTAVVDFCDAETAGVSSLYIIDLDSSLREIPDSFTGTSAIVAGNNPFILADKCTPSLNGCHSYCEDTCLRTVTFTIDPANTEDVQLRVCNVDSENCALLDGKYWYYEDETEMKTIMRNTQSDKLRYSAIALPIGSYRASFLDSTQTIVWPAFVREIYEDAMCDDVLMEGSIAVDVPVLEVDECNELIRNGNAEASDSQPLYWLHRKGGVGLDLTRGRNESHALTDLQQTDARKDAIAQYLDTRCLAANQGTTFEITAWVKLIDAETGEPYTCDLDTESCPEVGIHAYSLNGSRTTLEPVASMTNSEAVEGYQLMHGALEITEEVATASSVLFYVERNKVNLVMLVDDVSMTKRVEAGTPRPDNNTNNPTVVETLPSSAGSRKGALNVRFLTSVCALGLFFLVY